MSQSNLRETIKDILLTVNTQMATEKAEMWTNIILLAVEQDKNTTLTYNNPGVVVKWSSSEEDLTGASL